MEQVKTSPTLRDPYTMIQELETSLYILNSLNDQISQLGNDITFNFNKIYQHIFTNWKQSQKRNQTEERQEIIRSNPIKEEKKEQVKVLIEIPQDCSTKVDSNQKASETITSIEPSEVDNQNMKRKKDSEALLKKIAERSKEVKKFRIINVFKNKIRKDFKIDSMTRKLNLDFLGYILSSNSIKSNFNEADLIQIKNSLTYASCFRLKFISKHFSKLRDLFEDYLKSSRFEKLFESVRTKYDQDYTRLFYRHALNFTNYFQVSSNNKERKYCTSEGAIKAPYYFDSTQ